MRGGHLYSTRLVSEKDDSSAEFFNFESSHLGDRLEGGVDRG